MKPLLVIRPQPGCNATVNAAQALGLDAQGFPMFAIEPINWSSPLPESIDALLLGSANALRHAGHQLERYRGKPAYVVGEATAQAARDAGLSIAVTGQGGLQSLMSGVAPSHRTLLRLAGQNRVTLDLPKGHAMIERVVYSSTALPMDDAMAAMLREPALILLHSAEAAHHFAHECERQGVDRALLDLAALAPRIAQGAGSGWKSLSIADAPSDQALLALARQLCQ